MVGIDERGRPKCIFLKCIPTPNENKIMLKNITLLNSSLKQRDGGLVTTSSGFPLKGMLLPNVGYFSILYKTVDDFAKAFGIERAHRRYAQYAKMEPHFKPNKYLIRSFDRLNKYAKEGRREQFEKLHDIMLKHSASLMMLSLFKVDNTWYKRLSHKWIEYSLRRTMRLAKAASSGYSYKRVLIPKGDGRTRPLAVPPLHWRIYANMRYNLL